MTATRATCPTCLAERSPPGFTRELAHVGGMVIGVDLAKRLAFVRASGAEARALVRGLLCDEHAELFFAGSASLARVSREPAS